MGILAPGSWTEISLVFRFGIWRLGLRGVEINYRKSETRLRVDPR